MILAATNRAFDDIRLHVRLKLAALWTSVMFLYIYADYFGLFVPGNLKDMLDGKMGPLGPTTQGILLGTSVMMAIPSVMIALTLLLNPGLSRWLNITFGAVFSVIICITMWDWMFYVLYGVIEVAMTVAIVWFAWKWPRQSAA